MTDEEKREVAAQVLTERADELEEMAERMGAENPHSVADSHVRSRK